jgi:hypothetical protein
MPRSAERDHPRVAPGRSGRGFRWTAGALSRLLSGRSPFPTKAARGLTGRRIRGRDARRRRTEQGCQLLLADAVGLPVSGALPGGEGDEGGDDERGGRHDLSEEHASRQCPSAGNARPPRGCSPAVERDPRVPPTWVAHETPCSCG